jgi:DNA-directed RNA polymerase alpha subunit
MQASHLLVRTVNSNSSTAVNNCGSKSSEVGKVSSSSTNSNTVNAGGHMRLTLKISTGIGYDAAVARDDEATTIGGMQLDASFSPIRRVSKLGVLNKSCSDFPIKSPM